MDGQQLLKWGLGLWLGYEILKEINSNSPPVLSDGGVSPETGDMTTDFTYSVTYTDADDDPPASPTVSIDGAAAQTMTKKTGEDGDYTNGEVYEYTTSGLGTGSHTFQFAASDGVDAATGDTGSHAGPTVQNSPPSVASVSISPDPAYTNTDLTATPSGWSDPDGDTEGYQYQWQKLDGSWQNIPGATTNTLDSSNFVKDDQIKVICTPFDGTETGTPVEDDIIISNSLPTANAGPDQRALINTPITLDGSGSSDADGAPLTYLWTQTGGISVPLSDSTTVNPTFTTPVADTYTFSMVVNDGTDDSLPDTVVITVKASNIAPVLSDGAVNPASGYTSTTFTYSVVYTDDDNDSPMPITITIDGGTPQNMTVKAEEDGVYTNGEIYEYTATGAELGLGSHTFQFAASDGIDDATGDTGSHDGPTISSPPGGGGGGIPVGPPEGVTDVSDIVTPRECVFTEDATAKSDDGICCVTIDEGTTGLTKDGKPLSEISILAMEEPPPPPEDCNVIGLVYDFEPDGATFAPRITLTFTYDESLIPEGVAEENLIIATCDEGAGEWVNLVCVVNPTTNTITAQISHFTPFTILIYTRPAVFVTSDLYITPAEVGIGEEITISALVTNTGDLAGTYEVTLKIDDVVVATESVILAGGASRTVTFILADDVAGTYTVGINGLSGTFVVKAPVVKALVVKAPAAFTISALALSPAEVDIGEDITISALVTNTGDLAGTYEVTLKIDDVVVATESVILAGGASEKVTFTTSKGVAATYTVNLNGLPGTFVVKAGPNWWLIGGIIAGVIIIGLVIWQVITRRRV